MSQDLFQSGWGSPPEAPCLSSAWVTSTEHSAWSPGCTCQVLCRARALGMLVGSGWFVAGSRGRELHPQQRGGAESLIELPSLFPVSVLGACCRGCGDRLAGAEWSAGSGHHPSSGSDGQARLQDTARCGGCPLVCKAGVEVWEDVLRDSWGRGEKMVSNRGSPSP